MQTLLFFYPLDSAPSSLFFLYTSVCPEFSKAGQTSCSSQPNRASPFFKIALCWDAALFIIFLIYCLVTETSPPMWSRAVLSVSWWTSGTLWVVCFRYVVITDTENKHLGTFIINCHCRDMQVEEEFVCNLDDCIFQEYQSVTAGEFVKNWSFNTYDLRNGILWV